MSLEVVNCVPTSSGTCASTTVSQWVLDLISPVTPEVMGDVTTSSGLFAGTPVSPMGIIVQLELIKFQQNI